MPTFATPEPISAVIELYAGDVRIVASDRADTVVEVRPSDKSDESDVKAAQATRVDFADGTLTVRGPKPRMIDFSKRSRSVDLLVKLPAGSRLHVELSLGDCHGTGVLGECRVKTAAGNVHLDRTGPLRLDTSAGHLTVEEVGGDAEIATGGGKVRVGVVDGGAVVKNSNGGTEIGEITGVLRVRSANGDITVDRAGAEVEARTANGDIRVGEVARDVVVLNSGYGDLDVAVPEGVAAWLDLNTGHGRVRNSLEAVDRAPDESEQTVEVRARTSFGDITVRRS
ncbi:DUF4097 and DUF4098 domain-containing protein YvlB [Saccharothrix coeruleofusca]|uniref:DUF4097 family beta strand repeat-containing protein n=1 Tax=Saccharothrix coeruleofusca TaxID=33919 RepID=UPI001AE7FAA7|nr:DUF4097 family beta strand repeat-containing protein [Saccharothrix coeruleofusca]MBP2335009.1 DUF4097 and DUF4098 domain-containing protein YvlB [Saccharothrix coeruleofusca]